MSRFNVPEYNPRPIQSPQNALMQGLEMQRAQQGNALQQMQLQAFMQRAQQEQAAQAQAQSREQLRQKYLGSVDPSQGPAMPVNPLSAFAAGFKPDEVKAMSPADEFVVMGPGSTFGNRRTGTVGGNQVPFKPDAAKEPTLPQIAQLHAYAATLPPGDPRLRDVRGQLDNMARPPKYAASPGAGPAGPAAAPPPKPLPASALKMEQDALDKIGIASSINADLAAVESQINGGKLKFGPVSNAANAALNWAGMSTDESKNFSSFKSTLERLRNESLRLNTGVQTDGDSQRAWNELFQNINDTGLVQQRLGEIQRINARGAELQKLRADGVRANYGHPPVDASQYERQPAALNAPAAAAKPPGKAVKRTGTFNGRKVVEYTDGSIEYAD